MPAGRVLDAHTAEDGATIFQQACRMGLEGIVSKRLSAPYRSGPSRDWIKVKNPDSPAMVRARGVMHRFFRWFFQNRETGANGHALAEARQARVLRPVLRGSKLAGQPGPRPPSSFAGPASRCPGSDAG